MKVMEKMRVIIVLLLGMVALGFLTWGIGKIYLELVSQPNRVQNLGVQTSQGQTDNSLVLPAVTFWTCQIGVFQNELNAKINREQLIALGFQAEIISSSPWVVSIGLGHSASELKGLRTTLAEKDVLTVPKQIALPERTFRVAGNGTQLTMDLLKIANNIFNGGNIAEALEKENQLWNAQSNHPHDLEELHRFYSLLRAKKTLEEQRTLGLSLFFESQRVINVLSGK